MAIEFFYLSELPPAIMPLEEGLAWFSLPFLAFFLYYLFLAYPPSRDYFYNKVRWRTPINRNEFLRINSILSDKILYYKILSPNGKAKFINRLWDFISTKKFISKEGQQITDEVKILISSSAIILTFGLEKFTLSYFHTFFVYPSTFYSRLLRKELKGAAFGGGVISLSWTDFQKGHEIPDDGYNLGLHEMAHALKIDVLKGDDFDRRFEFYLDKWTDLGEKELSRMQGGEKSFLRAYGGKNEHEFFAVCIEYFFETPEIFNQKLPDIFKHLCLLLNQNPLNKSKDYFFRRERN